MAGKLMKAVQYNGYGGGPGALQHVEVPIPTPKKGELLVKLEASSLNPIDWKIQTGVLRPLLPPKFPFIPVTDIAGEVVEVGPGVKDFKSGIVEEVAFWGVKVRLFKWPHGSLKMHESGLNIKCSVLVDNLQLNH